MFRGMTTQIQRNEHRVARDGLVATNEMPQLRQLPHLPQLIFRAQQAYLQEHLEADGRVSRNS